LAVAFAHHAPRVTHFLTAENRFAPPIRLNALVPKYVPKYKILLSIRFQAAIRKYGVPDEEIFQAGDWPCSGGSSRRIGWSVAACSSKWALEINVAWLLTYVEVIPSAPTTTPCTWTTCPGRSPALRRTGHSAAGLRSQRPRNLASSSATQNLKGHIKGGVVGLSYIVLLGRHRLRTALLWDRSQITFCDLQERARRSPQDARSQFKKGFNMREGTGSSPASLLSPSGSILAGTDSVVLGTAISAL
jgi:hypothetical protein